MEIKTFSEDNRGLFSSDKIKEGKTVLFVPMSQIMTLKMAEDSPVGKILGQ